MANSQNLGSKETIELFSKYVIPKLRAISRGACPRRRFVCLDAKEIVLSIYFPAGDAIYSAIVPSGVVEAVQRQVATLIHVPNSWYIESQGIWAKMLSERSFGGQAFFCNSGYRSERGRDQACPAAFAGRSL